MTQNHNRRGKPVTAFINQGIIALGATLPYARSSAFPPPCDKFTVRSLRLADDDCVVAKETADDVDVAERPCDF